MYFCILPNTQPFTYRMYHIGLLFNMLYSITRIIINKNHRIVLPYRILIMQMPNIYLSIIFKSTHFTLQTDNRDVDSLLILHSFYRCFNRLHGLD